MWWITGLVCNAVVAVAYLLISLSIIRPLVKSGQLRSNPLGAATAAIFLTCAVHHGGHTVHMLMPYAGLEVRQGLAMRHAFDAQMALWDVITAAVGVYYWTLRRTYSSLMHGAQLFEDLKQREQQALELNDEVLQGIVVAKLALDMDDGDKARSALETAIGSASRIITDLLGPEGRAVEVRSAAFLPRPGRFRRAAGVALLRDRHDVVGDVARRPACRPRRRHGRRPPAGAPGVGADRGLRRGGRGR